ncbi:MAG: DUF1592 domain-containing protein [Myxococcota bacterium]|nr:DUF1592 domain-containing protein [Myxococcota bacterium]
MLPLILLMACGEDPTPTVAVRGAAPAVAPPEPSLRRLTSTQYRNAVADIFGEGIAITALLDPIDEVDGLVAVGASAATISPLGVERFESAAYQLAEQAMAEGEPRAVLVPCEPRGVVDRDCAVQALTPLALRMWRRPPSAAELEGLVSIAAVAAETLGDFYEGLAYAIAAMAQSPSFLFRTELGERGPDGIRRYTDYEMASRLSFFLWNTTPDDALLAAAAAGELTVPASLAAEVDRMLEDERTRQGVEAFFTDMLSLDELDSLNKDPLIFEYMSDDLGASAREETLAGIERLVFDLDGDYRDLLTGREVWIDRRLAAIYDVPAPSMDGFGWTTLPPDGLRQGLLGQVSTLALNAHATSTSVTLRGIYVREVLLCQGIPAPPSDVDTSIPEVSEDAPTMRERVAVHLEEPTCAACHQFTDPIGLGLENFDGIGRWRLEENGASIDPSGDLDGANFADVAELSEALTEHTAFASCLSQTLLRYGTGSALVEGVDDIADWHAAGFIEGDYRILPHLREIALSPAFSTAGDL